MPYGLYVEAPAGRVEVGTFKPGWVRSYDPDAWGGRGEVIVTTDQNEALTFTDVGAAMTLWKRQSTVRPLRADGKPNRPLTAFTVEVRPL